MFEVVRQQIRGEGEKYVVLGTTDNEALAIELCHQMNQDNDDTYIFYRRIS